MNRYLSVNTNAKQWAQISSQRTFQREEAINKPSSQSRFYKKQKQLDKSSNPKQYRSQNRSQRKLPYHIYASEQRKKSPFNIKQKIYRSYSQTKNKLSVPSSNDDFLIRIPKNQNLIENYIQQLKELKKKITEEKAVVQQLNKSKNQKNQHFSLKLLGKNKNLSEVAIKQDKQVQQSLGKTQQMVKGDQRIFSRDMKKHIKKLKIFKDFVDENEHEFEQEVYQNIKRDKLSTSKQVAINQHNDHLLHESQRKFQQQQPQKIIYGNVINFKQEFKIQRLPSEKKFNRYSSESGRKLYAISKSLNLREKQRMRTEQKIERYNSKSMALKRRKTQETERKVIMNSSPLKSINQNEVITTPTIINTERSPQKKKPSSHHTSTEKISPQKSTQQNQQPFKSIEGYSTIQAKKETIDILGQSCIQIKKNLMQSNKKMDHILDLLGYDMNEIQTHKDKKRKVSYERFSKAFPKGFFK